MPINVMENAWELQRNDPQAKSWSQLDKSSGLQVCKVVADIKASLNGLVAIQRDAANYPKWMDGVKSSSILEQGDDFYVTHTLVPSPWPVKDRDSVVRSNIRQQDDGKVIIEFSATPQAVPPLKGHERVPNVLGYWHFTPLEAGMTRLEYVVMVDPGGKLPTWLVNKFALDVPYQSIKAMHKLAQDARYQNLKSWIRETDSLYS